LMSEHTPYGDCPEIEICPEVDCDTCRKSVDTLFVITGEQLNAFEHLMGYKSEMRSRPLSSALKAERERICIILHKMETRLSEAEMSDVPLSESKKFGAARVATGEAIKIIESLRSEQP